MATLNPTPAESALMHAALNLPFDVETIDDESLIDLLEADADTLTELELELTVRLGAAWETIRRMDAQALAHGIALD